MKNTDHLLNFGDRAYLVAVAEYQIGSMYKITSYRTPTVVIAALHYLYGADFYSIHGGNINKTKKRFDGTVENQLEPYIRMCASRMPVLQYKKEDRIVANYLKGKGYPHFWPYLTWATPEGTEARKEIDAMLEKQPMTMPYREWVKRNENLKKVFSAWFKAFEKKHPKTKLKYWCKGTDFSTLYVSERAKTKHPSQLSAKTKEKIFKVYEAEMERYADFLVAEFCKRSKLFPKCTAE